MAEQIIRYILCRVGQELVVAFLGIPRRMRGKYRVLAAEYRHVGCRMLARDGVEPCAGDLTGLERFNESVFIDYSATMLVWIWYQW